MELDGLLQIWSEAGIDTAGWEADTKLASALGADEAAWWMLIAACEREIEGTLPDGLLAVLDTIGDLHHFTALRAAHRCIEEVR